MNPSVANKQYLKTTAISMVFYMIAIFGAAVYLRSADAAPDVVKYGLALLPALFVWWFLWGAIRFYKDTDEYERSKMVGGMLAGVVVLMLISSSWGFMEMLADAPRLPIFWILPIFFITSGLWQFFTKPRGEGC